MRGRQRVINGGLGARSGARRGPTGCANRGHGCFRPGPRSLSERAVNEEYQAKPDNADHEHKHQRQHEGTFHDLRAAGVFRDAP